ncbi:hypothetical protein [Acidisoma sp. 7E03]
MEIRFPWAPAPAPDAAETASVPRPSSPRPRGRRRARAADGATAWQHGRLFVEGPHADRDAFAQAARGPGITPWSMDPERLEEDVFHTALRVPAEGRNLSLEGCRRLARHYREAVLAHQARVSTEVVTQPAARVVCPLDLHRLLPVPAAVLTLGQSDDQAVAWCLAHWGVLELRRVTLVAETARPQQKRAERIGYDFWARGGAALKLDALRARWPMLLFSSHA